MTADDEGINVVNDVFVVVAVVVESLLLLVVPASADILVWILQGRCDDTYSWSDTTTNPWQQLRILNKTIIMRK